VSDNLVLYVGGRFVPRSDARISVLDRGFLYGDSIYETVRARSGRILFWRDHVERLRRSAAMLEIDLGASAQDPLPLVREVIARSDLADARIRIIVTRGEGAADQLDGFLPTWVVIPEAFAPLSEEAYEAGISAVLVHVRRNAAASLNPEIKSGNLLNNILAKREAVRAGAGEGVLVNPHGFLAEGSYSNLFWMDETGMLRTPSLSVGILPGITREKILRVAREAGVPALEVREEPDALDRASEIFFTSTSWEALSVTKWNGRPVGSGAGGPMARMLRERLRALYDDPAETA
jgi:branched-chain amino acid aminotransferase